eukprot:4198826-Alexandrium_andersonii.AAC.1
MRDLGAHISTTARLVSPTLSARMREGPRVCAQIASMPVGAEARARLVSGKVLPATTYGAS